MPSQVAIINIALSKIGDYYISSTTDGTKQATFALIHWENIRDSLLQSHPWNFATERVQLARLAGTPIGFDYKYQLPTDCLKVQKMSVDGSFDYADYINYKVEGGVLLSDETTVYIKYTKQMTDPSTWSPLFVRAFAILLALALSEPLGSAPTSDKQLLMQEYGAYIDEAKGVDFEEGQNYADNVYSLINCRDN